MTVDGRDGEDEITRAKREPTQLRCRGAHGSSGTHDRNGRCSAGGSPDGPELPGEGALELRDPLGTGPHRRIGRPACGVPSKGHHPIDAGEDDLAGPEALEATAVLMTSSPLS